MRDREDEVEVIQDNDNLPVLSNESLLSVAARAEKQVEAINKIKRVALNVTNKNDWVDQGGKPYLAVSGAEKVARVFGLSWRIEPPVYEIEPDGHFSYTYKGKFTLSGVSIEAIGSRSSKDKFFTKYTTQDGERVALPPSEIDKGDLQKAAFTNLLGNGITRLLGIRNLTWEDLASAGINRGDVQKVEYRNKGDKHQNAQSSYTPKRQEHQGKIGEYLNTLFGEDEAAKKAKLVELTSWTKTKDKDGNALAKPQKVEGVSDLSLIKSDTTIDIIYAKLKKEVEESQVKTICSQCHKEECECEVPFS